MYVVCCVGSKTQVGVKLDDDNLKILDDLPSSAVEMQVKSKVVCVCMCACMYVEVNSAENGEPRLTLYLLRYVRDIA